ncbi:MAG: hypothetical protein P8X50_14375 [Maritimibacter sp.]
MLGDLFHMTKTWLHRFSRDEDAVVVVEAMLVLPILLWAFGAGYVYFDAFRAKNLATKGNYAISDLLSRETNTVNANYVEGMGKVYQYLTRSNDKSWIRSTVVVCTDKCDQPDRELTVAWSYATKNHNILTDAAIAAQYDGAIPVMALGEVVIVMETHMQYVPALSEKITGLWAQDFYDIVMTRPRFVDNIPCDWQDTSYSSCKLTQ